MKRTSIGGQAVIEGVMMRGAESVAIAVRDANGQIRLDTKRQKLNRNGVRKIPFVRGVFNFFDSMVLGVQTLTKAAEVVGDEEELTEKKSETSLKFWLGFSVFLGIALSVGLFIFLPNLLTGWVLQLFSADLLPIWKNLIEGGFRLLIFLTYLLLISLMKDIRRTFMYHGAEHKTINCYEAERELTVENVRQCTTFHDRCGTSFLIFVMIISILLFALTGWSDNVWIRLGIRLALLPVIAGISYEILKFLAAHPAGIFAPMRWMGKMMQKITTREPDDGMIEVAIAAFQAVLEMDADPSVPERDFPKAVPLKEWKELQNTLLLQNGVDDAAALDWILCDVLQKKRNELKDNLMIPFNLQLKAEEKVNRLKTGEPLQYILGNAEFYGRTFEVEQGVLIPRPETELLTEQALKHCSSETRALDLCCGSGCIGITLYLEKKCSVLSADLSDKALEVTERNAKRLHAKIEIVKSDLTAATEGTFDLIVCNPPYIPTKDIDGLERNVKDFEPKMALDGGADGLDFYRKLAEQVPSKLNDGGTLCLEVGEGQAPEVCRLLQNSFATEIKKDYRGIERIVVARK